MDREALDNMVDFVRGNPSSRALLEGSYFTLPRYEG